MNVKKLKGYMAENDITIEMAAKKSNLNYNTVQRFLSTGRCTLDTARALIVGMKIPLQLANEIFFDNTVVK